MRNRDMPANPIFDERGSEYDHTRGFRSGLTKLEYAAIQILQGAITDLDLIDPVACAIDAANELFDRLEKQEQSE